MNCPKTSLALVALAAACALWSCPIEAQPSLDLRVLIDVSEPAHANDEGELRAAFVEALVQQLPEESVGGMWGYARLTQRLVKRQSTGPLWRQVAAIHARHLTPQSRYANLERAVLNVLPDLNDPERGVVELVLLSNGRLELDSAAATDESRDRLLSEIANRLAAGRVRVHSIGFGLADAEGTNPGLVGQLAEVTGGLVAQLESADAAVRVARDLVRLFQIDQEPVLDSTGRFRVPIGTERLTVFWDGDTAGGARALTLPDGTTLSHEVGVVNGRWLRARRFEMVTIGSPPAGWWRVEGSSPTRVGVYGDLKLGVSGLKSPVIPSDETAALIRVWSDGHAVVDDAFLDRLELRAWLVDGGRERALPVERSDDAFRAFLVNLDDGAYEFRAELVGPTFRHEIVRPFTARNPLTVEVRSLEDGTAEAWVTLNHAQIRYDSLRVVAKVRKPPEIGTLVPAVRHPGGLWRLPVAQTDGVLEVTFTISGNYLNGEGFYLKSMPTPIHLPIAPDEPLMLRFNARGKRIQAALADKPDPQPLLAPPDLNEPQPQVETVEVSTPPPPDPTRRLPIWFVGLITACNLGLLALIYWLLKPRVRETEAPAPG